MCQPTEVDCTGDGSGGAPGRSTAATSSSPWRRRVCTPVTARYHGRRKSARLPGSRPHSWSSPSAEVHLPAPRWDDPRERGPCQVYRVPAPLTLVTGHEDAHTSILWVIGPLDDLTADSFETEASASPHGAVCSSSSCRAARSFRPRVYGRSCAFSAASQAAIALVTADAHFEMLFRLAGLERRLPTVRESTEALATAGAPHPWGGSAPTEHARAGRSPAARGVTPRFGAGYSVESRTTLHRSMNVRAPELEG